MNDTPHSRVKAGEPKKFLRAARPSGSLAVVSDRFVKDLNDLEDFPTPPWAVRALIPYLEKLDPEIHRRRVWEPTCNRGIMAEVLRETFAEVIATDIAEYGYAKQVATYDFLSNEPHPFADNIDWGIYNPPFDIPTNAALWFALKMLRVARIGVACFVRLQWLETITRYERLFRSQTPFQICQFVERVPIVKGRYDPEAGTMTSYIWVIWRRRTPFDDRDPKYLWIPPGRAEALTRYDDAARFAEVRPLPLVDMYGHELNANAAAAQSPTPSGGDDHVAPQRVQKTGAAA